MPGLWALDADAAADLTPRAARIPRVAAYDGRTLVVADGHDLFALDLAPDGTVIRRYLPAVLPSEVRGLRLQGGSLYTVDSTDAAGDVAQLGDGLVIRMGGHSLESWVDNAAWIGKRAFRRTPAGVEVAFP
jgi:hypothetical protein